VHCGDDDALQYTPDDGHKDARNMLRDN
jgi:hypothetical protein